MKHLAPLGFVAIPVAVVLLVWQLAPQHPLVTEADNRDLLAGMATGQALQLTAIAPTPTPYHSPTPRPTERPPTETPLPTWSADAAPGVYAVPAWTEVPAQVDEVDKGLQPCRDVTPEQWKSTNCKVDG